MVALEDFPGTLEAYIAAKQFEPKNLFIIKQVSSFSSKIHNAMQFVELSVGVSLR